MEKIGVVQVTVLHSKYFYPRGWFCVKITLKGEWKMEVMYFVPTASLDSVKKLPSESTLLWWTSDFREDVSASLDRSFDPEVVPTDFGNL